MSHAAEKRRNVFVLLEKLIDDATEKLDAMMRDGTWKPEPVSTATNPTVYVWPWTSEPLASLVLAAGGREHFVGYYYTLLADSLQKRIRGQMGDSILTPGVSFTLHQ